MVNRDSLVRAFKEEVSGANQESFPIYVDSFTNLWQYEFGSLDDLPSDIDDLVAQRAIDLGLIDLE